MIRFEIFEHLYALMLIPILLGIFLLLFNWRKKSMATFGNLDVVKRLMPEYSQGKHLFKLVFFLLGISFLIIAWANPQRGLKKEKVKRKSVDVFIALDISHSMLAQDILPNRLEKAKRFTQNLVKALKGERIGLIIFAGNAYLQVPLTTDYAAAVLFAKSANTAMAPTQGTAIVEAIDLAERSFEEENKNHKALIIITDGENHDKEALDRVKDANENGLLAFTVGVGTEQGSFIPIEEPGKTDYKRDKTGNPVRSKLNEAFLQELSSTGGGTYVNLSGGSENVLTTLRSKIDNIEKREFEQRVFNEFESYFQYFILLALVFLAFEFMVSYRRSKVLGDRDIFKI